MDHHPARITRDLERIDTQSGSREDQIRVYRRPGFCQPSEIDSGVFQIRKPVGRDHSGFRFSDGVRCPQFGNDISECGMAWGNEGYVRRCECGIEGDPDDVTAGNGHARHRCQNHERNSVPDAAHISLQRARSETSCRRFVWMQ